MRLSLSVKWRAALLAVGVLPLVVATVATLRIQRRGLERAEKELELAVDSTTARWSIGWLTGSS